MSLYPLTFQPVFKERVWGGRRLGNLFAKALPAGVPIGEAWEITDRPEGVSVVASGRLAGRDLRWLMEAHGAELLGRPVAAGERFPWLIKILDASDDLSLQVHPPAHKAVELQGEPKTELWYFADTAPGARIYVGLKPGTTRDEFARRAADGSVAQCFHVHSTQPGDVMFVPSGRVHALGRGNMVFEIQQNSDTTYRVFDWNRLGLDGRPRALHLESSLASIDFTDVAPDLVRSVWIRDGFAEVRPLARHAWFNIDEIKLPAATPLANPRPPGTLAVFGVVRGGLRITGGGESVGVGAGGFVMLPAALNDAAVQAETPTTLLRVLSPGRIPDR